MYKTIEQKVLKLIDENHLIEKNDKILVALSGGGDSVFLLHFLLKFKRRLGVHFSAFHLNHKIRGEDAKKDEKFCKKLCDENSVELFTVVKVVKGYAKKNKLSVEEAGRILRYKELNKIAGKKSFNKIATAHNASDNAETVLLNLIKGAGSKGLSGIPVQRDKIIRPMLSLTSDEIRNYLIKKKINYRLDASNLNIDYERNYIRNKIIPELKKLNPKVEEKILSSSKIIKELRGAIEEHVESAIRNSINSSKVILRISLKKLNKLEKSFWNEFFKSAIERKFKIDLSAKNINDLTKLTESQSSKKINLSNKIIATREREFISIGSSNLQEQKIIQKKIKAGDSVDVNGYIFQIEQVKTDAVKTSHKKNIEYISADKAKSFFQLRSWKDGDRFYPLGMKGSKKISDFLIDEKVSSSQKKKQLVLTNDGKIVWVVGLRIDERFKITSQTKKVFILSYK
ncbi:MAG: tRNA lysidine(34) synthetase TilS [Ignavibacteria bacterium]|nr:tRNA lysidine(34) synthetase TilS [Ignavibacteria bacterium]MBT8382168.1 tRNA lysidine(34) synthetase TilS [Ignavibacteria bacterium]MBT8392732.1 tRNA lysidine(34) synthetase TilS [Ignavibacteria bacterium]NNJ51846.1 tRNA lysidine(34) synthetase TilS [Ignavibacteriaceae bacterium]NNL21945.1 tRNA lysidine(34) synthetase TilS [Ignavibacteriaceae bacterium]